MTASAGKAIAIVGVGGVLPDAPDVATFWRNIREGRYSIGEVPVERWDPAVYWDPDPRTPDRSYSKIGGWVRSWDWDPLRWKLPIPPRVSDAMDVAQKWAILAARETLADYGYPDRALDGERTAVIMGNAMGGDLHLFSSARLLFPEYADELAKAPGFASLPVELRQAVMEELRAGIDRRLPPISEDTMPGELSNIVAGRLASLFDFKGPNYVVDAACASAMAAILAAIHGLEEYEYDAVLTGGVEANMSASSFIKFCKIGALSATGTRPYGDGADGFVMGEGAVTFLLKRLEDAEAAGDRVHAVIRGVGGSSDGRGKGITAPNPIGQKLAVQRAWENAGLTPSPGDMIEGHGTSTRVGDVVEVESMSEVLREMGVPNGALALGSVKSNVGHLKAAAGAAGILKATLSLRDGILPPTLNCETPNPAIDFAASPLRPNTTLREWEANGGPRRAGISAFGFGGTNFHTVLEEYIPGRLPPRGRRSASVVSAGIDGATNGGPAAIGPQAGTVTASGPAASGPHGSASHAAPRTPLRGALVLGAATEAELVSRLEQVRTDAAEGRAPAVAPPLESDLRAPVRLAIDYGSAAELADRADRALKAFREQQAGRWKALRAKGIFIGRGDAPRVAFLFTGQGSQYVNMLRRLRETEPIVTATFAEADGFMEPILGRKLTDYILVDAADEAALAGAEEALKQTAITQPAVLATETALARLIGSFGIRPDMVMGHSLGEYGALVAAGALPFGDALKAVAARGTLMAAGAGVDNGQMAAVFGPIEDVRRVLETVDGYVVIANINSTKECVIGGATDAVQRAIPALREAGFTARQIPVSHAFHTRIVESASVPLAATLRTMELRPPRVPIIANVTGDFYPMGSGVEDEMLDMLSRQVGEPVQFVRGLETLYRAGARVFVEMGPKRVLYGFVEAVLGDRENVLPLFTNHPRIGEAESVNQALCGLYAAGLGTGIAAAPAEAPVVVRVPDATTPVVVRVPDATTPVVVRVPDATTPLARATSVNVPPVGSASTSGADDRYVRVGRMFVDFMERSMREFGGGAAPERVRVGVTGASLGLPGVERVYDDSNVERLLRGDQFIAPIPDALRGAIAGKSITRLVKGKDGEARFETIDDPADVIKLAGRSKTLDMERDFAFPADRLQALDIVTRLAIAAGIDALRDAGIPLVMRYRTTTRGTQLPDRWALPEAMRDETGVIFASAFPGYDSFAEILTGYERDRARRALLAELEALKAGAAASPETLRQLDERIAAVRAELAAEPYTFDRRFLFRVLAMGHSQFAEYIGARGPNVQTNGACASTTQATAMARDWIETGRCRRVVIVTADDITTDNLMEWFGSGFLASGAAATDARVEDAALPFDRRRHGLIIGMGGAALVMESLDAARERGVEPICELLSAVTANSAFHGSRLDVEHICDIMEGLVADAERRWGLDRREMAGRMVFVSHETYTPARGGSASAEALALRRVFGADADRIVIANTKGYTGHPMAVGIEDVLAVKILETGVVPPVANFREVDPELGVLNLSRGGSYPVDFALRLGAGFGSQVAMSLFRWNPPPDGARRAPNDLGFGFRVADEAAWKTWLAQASGQAAPELEVVGRTLRVVDHHGARVGSGNGAAAASTPAAVPRPAAPRPAVPQGTASPLAGAAPATNGADADGATTSRIVAVVDPVADRVMAIIAEKTGYPPDMLDMELDLEADLGIDTVKQAEMFVAIREAYDIPRDDNLRLRDYPTLRDAVGFVRSKRPDLALPEAAPAPVAAGQPQAPAAAAPAAAATDPVAERVLAIIAEKTGYPPDMLDMELDLEADLGIDTVKQAEMFVAIREAYDIPRDDNLRLRDYPTLRDAVGFVRSKRPDLALPEPAAPAPAAVHAGGQPSAHAGSQPHAPGAAAARGGAVPVAPTLQGVAADPVAERVLAIIAEKTGYPPDMLDMELDLEADLGIDTVKQAEMFVAIREAYDIPRDDNLRLRDYPTLRDAVGFVRSKRPDLALPEAAAPAPAAVHAGGQPAAGAVLDGDAAPAPASDAAPTIPRRVPVARVRPDLAVFRTTGVRLEAGSRVVVMSDHGGTGAALAARLAERGVDVLAVEDRPDADALVERIIGWAGDAAVHGVYWLPALDAADGASLDGDGCREALRHRVKLLYAVMRALYPHMEAAGTFLLSASRLGGRHGYDAAGAAEPMGGAVTGFTKAFRRERTDALVKAVDFETGAAPEFVAEQLIAETLADPAAAEVGYADGHRWAIGLEEQPLPDGTGGGPAPGPDGTGAGPAPGPDGTGAGPTLGPDATYLVTGAAGSIVAAIVADLAAASGGTFHLLDLTPAPDAADPDLDRLTADREGLKRDLFERAKSRGERATPAAIEREVALLERKQAALSAIRAVEAAGGTAVYHCVNMLDEPVVAAAVAAALGGTGRIDVLLHAAGLEISRLLPDKTPAEFDRVFDVKATGWYNVMRALGDAPLGAVVAFSSIAGRFGNGGQADYSAANDLLCKEVSALRSRRPGTLGIAIDWTAWADIGMAARGSIPQMMKLAGIDMLPPMAGIPFVRRQLEAGVSGEVVAALSLGAMAGEVDPLDGLDMSPEGVARLRTAGPLTGEIAGFGAAGGLVVRITADPAAQPFLHDHCIGGTPVLPGVMGLEAMAGAAALLFPDRHVVALEDVAFLAPFKFYRSEPRVVTVQARFAADGDDVMAECSVIGERALHGRDTTEVTVHHTARVRLARAPLAAAERVPPASIEKETAVGREAVYGIYFHGPAYQVVGSAGRTGQATCATLAEGLPPNHEPAALPLLVAPRLVELCFQAAGLDELAEHERMGLPSAIDRVELIDAVEREGAAAVVVQGDGAGYGATVTDGEGNVLVRVSGYRTMPLPGTAETAALAPLKGVRV
jgi:acyl transferase domain-containing protein/acyl carrier protein